MTKKTFSFAFKCCAALLPILVLMAGGCGRAVNRGAERRVRDALPDLLGPAKQYRVHVGSAPGRTVQGRLGTVTIDGVDVRLSNGLLLDLLHLDLRGVAIDTRRGRVERVESAAFSATLGEASLDEFLAGESPPDSPLRKVRLHLADNAVTIAGQRVILGLDAPFQLTGPVRVAGPQRIEIDPTRLTVVGIPFQGVVLRFLKGRFESAIDLSRLPFPVRLSSVQAAPGRLILQGSADVSPLLDRAQRSRR